MPSYPKPAILRFRLCRTFGSAVGSLMLVLGCLLPTDLSCSRGHRGRQLARSHHLSSKTMVTTGLKAGVLCRGPIGRQGRS